jgi:hypothetical protein
VAAPKVPLLIIIPGDVDPIERGERFQDPIGRALRQNGRLGRVVGGGTSMSLGGPRFITSCYVDVDVKDAAQAIPVLRRALLDAEVPRGTRVLNCDTEEVLLSAPAAGILRTPKRQKPPPEYPWAKGEILGYRLSSDVLALLFVIESGRYPIFRVLNWSGSVAPSADVVAQLLCRHEPMYAIRRRMYAIGWAPMSLRCAIRLPSRLDEKRLVRTGLVVPFCQEHLHRRMCAFDTWPNFDKLLRQLFGLESMNGSERLMNELGVGSLAHHFAVGLPRNL